MHPNQTHKLWTRAANDRDKAKKELQGIMQIMDDFLELYDYRQDFQNYLDMVLTKSMKTDHMPYQYGHMRQLHLRFLKDKQ